MCLQGRPQPSCCCAYPPRSPAPQCSHLSQTQHAFTAVLGLGSAAACGSDQWVSPGGKARATASATGHMNACFQALLSPETRPCLSWRNRLLTLATLVTSQPQIAGLAAIVCHNTSRVCTILDSSSLLPPPHTSAVKAAPANPRLSPARSRMMRSVAHAAARPASAQRPTPCRCVFLPACWPCTRASAPTHPGVASRGLEAQEQLVSCASAPPAQPPRPFFEVLLRMCCCCCRCVPGVCCMAPRGPYNAWAWQVTVRLACA